nr:glutathione S-transferase [Gammaproteobacteria bacterium]
MELFVSDISPYARLTRIICIEKGLSARVALNVRATRIPNNPLYELQPSGRIPTLVTDDGTVFEDSSLICAYLDHLDDAPQFDRPSGGARWHFWQREARARSLMDGLSVWQRELARPESDRSSAVIEHECERAMRIARAFERDIDHPVWNADFNMPQMLLIVALQMNQRLEAFDWEGACPRLESWASQRATR